LVRSAVIDPASFCIDYGDQVRGVLADEPENLFAVEQPPAHAVQLELLINRVEVEQEDHAEESDHLFTQRRERLVIPVGVQQRQEERRDPCRKQERNADGGGPQQPLPVLNSFEPLPGVAVLLLIKGCEFA